MNLKKCVNCKYYDSDRRNEDGSARCSIHPFWVKDDEACESFEADKETKKAIDRMTIKEKIVGSLGVFGLVMYYLVQLMVIILPFVMIGGGFFLTLLLTTIEFFLPLTSVVFWIWGLVCAIKGVQDIWAIIYYIAFVIIWLPFFVSTVLSIFSRRRR